MFRFALMRWIRGLIPALMILLILACGGMVVWISVWGVPRPLVNFVEEEIQKQGVKVHIGSLKVSLWSGVTVKASDIEVFPGFLPEGKPLGSIGNVRIDLDSSDLWDGIVTLRRIEIGHVSAKVPVDFSKMMQGVYLDAGIESGVCSFPSGASMMDIQNVRGKVQGMGFVLNGRVVLPEDGDLSSLFFPGGSSTGSMDAGKVLQDVLEQMKKVHWTKDHPPMWRITVSDDRQRGGGIRAAVDLDVPSVSYDSLQVRDLTMSVEYAGGLVWLKKLSCRERLGNGTFELSSRADLASRAVQVYVKSSIPVLKWVLAFSNSPVHLPYGLELKSSPSFHVASELRFNEAWNDLESIKVVGSASVPRFLIGEDAYDRFSTDFSYNNGDFYISDFSVIHKQDSLRGQVMGKGGELKFDVRSTLGVGALVHLVRSFGDSKFEMPKELTLRGDPDLVLRGTADFPQGWTGEPVFRNAEVKLNLKDFAVMDVDMGSIVMDAQYKDDRFVINRCALERDGHGMALKGVIMGKEVYFSATSSFPPKVLEQLLKGRASFPKQLQLPQSARLSARGSLDFNDLTYGGIHLLNVDLEASEFSWNQVPFSKLNLAFKFENGDLVVKDCRLTRSTGTSLELFGRGNLGGDMFLMGRNTITLDVWDKILGLDDDDFFIQRFRFNKDTNMDLSFQASVNLTDPENQYDLDAILSAANVEYKKVLLTSASAKAHVVPGSVVLTNPVLVCDNRGFLDSRNIRGGTAKSTVKADTVKFDFLKDTVEVVGINGRVYPDYTIRMFSDSATKVLSTFKFYSPVQLQGRGVFPMGDDMRLMQGRITFNAYSGLVTYPLLGTTLEMRNGKGTLNIDPAWVKVSNLSGTIWGGSFTAKIDARIDERDDLNGVVSVKNLDLKSIGQSYDEKMSPAYVNGDVNFRSQGGNVNSLKGEGMATLSQGNLVEIPLFGTLGKVIGSVVPGVKHLINYNITTARCDFVIENGYIKTASENGKSFQAQGSNMGLTGGGWIRLSDLYVNADLRVSLRGLPGLVTSPLFMIAGGLFRVRGTGPLSNVEWTPAPFSGGVSAPPAENKGSVKKK